MDVSLVIPARDAEATLGACLDAVVPHLATGALAEILVVDDGSRDGTAELCRRYPVRRLTGAGAGPGAARNQGWRRAGSELVWFLDADCVADRDALAALRPHLDDEEVAAAGGTYRNLRPESRLATLIQDEIAARHRAARGAREVDYLASFDVLFRRRALEGAGGFDESLITAEDVDLAYRVRHAGGRLVFDPRSRVGHFHPDRLLPYLRTQARHARFRTALYARHPWAARGDDYSRWTDNLQPPLALATLLLAPALLWPSWRWLPAVPLAGLVLAQLPMTARLARNAGARALRYPFFGTLRAFAWGLGLAAGLTHLLRR